VNRTVTYRNMFLNLLVKLFDS